MRFVRKRKLNQLTKSRQGATEATEGSRAAADHPDEGRQTKPRSRGRCRDQNKRRRIDPADHRQTKSRRRAKKVNNYRLSIIIYRLSLNITILRKASPRSRPTAAAEGEQPERGTAAKSAERGTGGREAAPNTSPRTCTRRRRAPEAQGPRRDHARRATQNAPQGTQDPKPI